MRELGLLLTFLIEHDDVNAGSIQLRSNSHLLRQGHIVRRQLHILLVALSQLRADAVVLVHQLGIQLVQRINLQHIAAQDGTYGSQFLLQTGNLCCIVSLRTAQLFEQRLCTLLLTS